MSPVPLGKSSRQGLGLTEAEVKGYVSDIESLEYSLMLLRLERERLELARHAKTPDGAKVLEYIRLMRKNYVEQRARVLPDDLKENHRIHGAFTFIETAIKELENTNESLQANAEMYRDLNERVVSLKEEFAKRRII